MREVDVFRKVGNKSVRVRKDQKTNAVVQVCEKVRLGDLNIACPGSKFDWRLSISTETPSESLASLSKRVLRARVSGCARADLCRFARLRSRRAVDYVPEGADHNMRGKDRLSYAHQTVQVDLTQVTTEVCPPSRALGPPRPHFQTDAHSPLSLLLAPSQDGKKKHELEVEVLDVEQMLGEALAFEREERNCYEDLVGVLVASVRLLIRNAAQQEGRP